MDISETSFPFVPQWVIDSMEINDQPTIEDRHKAAILSALIEAAEARIAPDYDIYAETLERLKMEWNLTNEAAAHLICTYDGLIVNYCSVKQRVDSLEFFTGK